MNQRSHKGRELLEQPLDFYQPDVLPAAQRIVSKHYRKRSYLVVFYFTDMILAPPCLTNSVTVLKGELS